jgi:hypothetical protein
MYTKNELMFPHHAISSLRRLRGASWKTLVERVITLPECHEETLAFMLMMVRLNGCMACETDSYRAMRGCAACSLQTLRRFKAGRCASVCRPAASQTGHKNRRNCRSFLNWYEWKLNISGATGL